MREQRAQSEALAETIAPSTERSDPARTPAPISGADALAQTLVSVPGAGSQVKSTPPPAGDSESLTGTRLDHFVVGARLGIGGMGEVYAAHDTSLDRAVAIKVLRDDVHLEKDHIDRFLREARAQARLNHPNIVHIYYIGQRPSGSGQRSGQSSLFFAMERVLGGDLDRVVREGSRLDPEDARQYMLQVAKGLRAAQRGGVIHRDVKPSNLMCTEDGLVKIADFGLAKPVESDLQITQRGALVGSPWYMPPEQILGEEIDFRADMYAMGACFYHLIAGKVVFDGPRPMVVCTKHLNDPVPSVRKERPEVPEALAAIVERLLAKKPDDRYPSYDALIAALEAAAPAQKTYAGVVARAAAATIDFLVLAVAIGVLGWPGLLLYLIAVTLAQAWRGQTPGKYFLQIEARRDDGSRLGPVRSIARTLSSLWMPIVTGATIALSAGLPELLQAIDKLGPRHIGGLQSFIVATAISQGVLTLLWLGGLLMSAFHPKRKTLHDLIAGSVVTYRLAPDHKSNKA
ncbi:MAG: protein kinase [Sandaracinaceae bacterium]|nr:protein kinase [Sandaracinaceae bacterium]